ncbi:MAG: hypothetical protein AAFP79_13845 [Pseudomonadota bacterium]
MSEHRTLLSGWPDWARMLLFYALLPLFVLAIVMGYAPAFGLLLGPVLFSQAWLDEAFGGYTRADSPILFWSAVAICGFLTANGGFQLYQTLTEVPV